MSIERAIELVRELHRIDGAVLDAGIDAGDLDALMRRRQDVVWSLHDACAPSALEAIDAPRREVLASLLRSSVARGDAARSALESQRDRTLVELASTAPSRRLAVDPPPRFTERVA